MHPETEIALRRIDEIGERPPDCPWRVYQDSFVRAVLECNRFMDSGTIETWAGGDPPNALVEGVLYYQRCYNLSESKRIENDRIKRSVATTQSNGAPQPTANKHVSTRGRVLRG
jgi:hypothetical protein